MAKQTARPADIQLVAADWNDTDGLIEAFKTALTALGISMIDHPDFEGSDTYGFLLSRRPLTEAEIKAESIDPDPSEKSPESDSIENDEARAKSEST